MIKIKINPILSLFITIFISIFLTGCGGGGGGGGGGEKSDSSLSQQNLTFAYTGSIDLYLGDSLQNTATGQGSGLIAYSSNNPEIVTVDSEGLITAIAAGSATITANIDQDNQYFSASSSYQVNSEIKTISMTAWVGKSDTKIQFSESDDNILFYRSAENECNLESYNTCKNGQLSTINGQIVTDTAATLSQPAFYNLVSDTSKASVTVTTSEFSGREGHQVIAFKEKLWLIGGYDGLEYQNDIWSSSDGIIWELQTKNAPFPLAWSPKAAVYNNKLWVVLSPISNPENNEIWSSDDGITWELVTDNPNFPSRITQRFITHDDKLWIIGGAYRDSTGDNFHNDVWSSTNGVTWTLVTEDPSFLIGWAAETISFNNKLWMIGALGFDFTKSEIWSSEDGEHWKQVSEETPFMAREDHQLVSHDNKLWVIGGSEGGSPNNINDIWSSTDGVRWQQETESTPFSSRENHQAISFTGKIWLIGGRSGGMFSGLRNDIWSSIDGVNWQQHTKTDEIPPRTQHQAIYYKNKYWIIGGSGSSKNDIWSSSNGADWTLATDSPNFPFSYRHQVAIHNEKMWLVGGNDGACCEQSHGLKNDVWSSIDGIDWKLESETPGFSARFGHQLISYDERLWLIGGTEDYGDTGKKDIWSSIDGINWTLVTDNPPFISRHFHQALNFNNKIWVFGGKGDLGSDDVMWSSTDGINWSKETLNPIFNTRYDHQFVAFKNKLWLIGGWDTEMAEYTNDIWSSMDGVNWTLETSSAPFSARGSHEIVSNGDHLLLIGGQGEGINNDIWKSEDGIQWRKLYKRQVYFATPR
ncbi:Ig-like domain-containing protein [Microbulbifer sp. EKSA008]|uniref:Kelch repeat-containing protein n=1 Tax=Microbulbifer sp. EKSA008 TaxID=3243367 RepID=UPI00404174B8